MHHNVDQKMLYNSGRGIILPNLTEPLYRTQYLPRKFKINVTVPRTTPSTYTPTTSAWL